MGERNGYPFFCLEIKIFSLPLRNIVIVYLIRVVPFLKLGFFIFENPMFRTLGKMFTRMFFFLTYKLVFRFLF